MSPLLGISGIIYAFYFVLTHPSASGIKGGYFDLPGLVLIGLTPPCALLLSHTLSDLLTGVGTLLRSLFRRRSSTQHEVINALTQASALVRSQGMGALLQVRNHVRYDLLRDGISLIVNNFTPEEIRHNLSAKINAKQSRYEIAANLFENMSRISPGVGMMGTLLGLIDMLAHMSDPSKIGPGMALAMITTLYGLLVGTLIYAPAAEKISLEAQKELEIDLMVLDGVLGIKGKKSSLHLSDIVKTYGQVRGQNAPARRGA